MTDRILCVDDDQNILDAYRRGLRKQFRIDTALGAEQALKSIVADDPYAVVVSDMQMPGMNGIQFLTAVRQRAPDTVRMMLTGMTDLDTAIGAVNEGNIFRFMTKPCSPETLAKALTAGVKQYRLITAEKELLGKTLRGSIKVLNDVLSLANPTAFGHASRVRSLVGQLCKELKANKSWQCEMAAMLSQIGCVTIPPDTLDKIYHRKKLSSEEIEMFEAHPGIGRDLIANIPRLSEVARIIAFQQKCFNGKGPPSGSVTGQDIPLGSRILKVALDYDAAKWGGLADYDAIGELRSHSDWYDPDVLVALEAVVGIEEMLEEREIQLDDLAVGMSLAQDISTVEGMTVAGKGLEVTSSLCERIKNFARHRQLVEPIHVLVRCAKEPEAVA